MKFQGSGIRKERKADHDATGLRKWICHLDSFLIYSLKQTLSIGFIAILWSPRTDFLSS